MQFESDFQEVRLPGFATFFMRYSMLRHYAEGHVVHHVDPGPHHVGGQHGKDKFPGEV